MNMPLPVRDFTGSLRPQAGPETRFIQFSTKSMVNRSKSKEAGRPVYDARVFIKIQNPGDNLHITERPATDADAAEFPGPWRAFQEGREAIPDGTSISVLFPQNPEIWDNLKSFKVYTIEQLAGLTDTQIQAIGLGGRKMSQDAQAYLKAASSGADFHKLREDVNKLMLQLKAATDQNEALKAELTKREAAAKVAQPNPGMQPAQAQQPRR